MIGGFAGNTIADVLLHDYEPEWAQEQGAIREKSLTRHRPFAATRS
jgi:hypothetical protein